MILCPTHRRLTLELVGARVVRHRCPTLGCGYMRLMPRSESDHDERERVRKLAANALAANRNQRGPRKRAGVTAYSRPAGVSP